MLLSIIVSLLQSASRVRIAGAVSLPSSCRIQVWTMILMINVAMHVMFISVV